MQNTVHKKSVSWFAVGLVGVSLAACSDGGGNNGGGGVVLPPPPPPPMQTVQEQLGATFAVAFNQSSTDDPIDPVDGDVIALDLTADPLDAPDP